MALGESYLSSEHFDVIRDSLRAPLTDNCSITTRFFGKEPGIGYQNPVYSYCGQKKFEYIRSALHVVSLTFTEMARSIYPCSP